MSSTYYWSGASSTSQTHQTQRRKVGIWAAATAILLLLVIGSSLIAWSLIASNNKKENVAPSQSSSSIEGDPSPPPTRSPIRAGTPSNEPTTALSQSPSGRPTTIAPSTAPLSGSTESPTLASKGPGATTTTTTTTPSMDPSSQPATNQTKNPTIRPSLQPTATIPLKPTSEPNTNQPTMLVLDCLRSIPGLQVVTASADEYNAARVCLVYPPISTNNSTTATTTEPQSPLAIVQPSNVEIAAAVVACAAQFPPTTVSARSGAHSFTASSCRGTVILDLQRLDSFQVQQTVQQSNSSGDAAAAAALVTWGAGSLHGQVYGKLLSQNLVIPGGAEVMVGTGGLWLGCGRGPLTQAYGLSCDQLQSVEYIDATGTIRTTDNANDDLLWMAKGAGNFFPGIVTKFTARAFAMPNVVYKESCFFPNTPTMVEAAVRTYTLHLNEMNDPDRRMFGALIVERPHVKLEFHCFGCSGATAELQSLLQLKETMVSDIEAVSVAGEGNATLCESKEYSYGDYLLQSTTWDTYETLEDLEKRSQWPEWKDFTGKDLKGFAYNGGILVPDDWSFTEDLIDDIVAYTQTLPGNAADRTFLDYFSIYPLKGRGSGNVELASTAFGGRGSQAVIHYKKDKVETKAEMFKQHMDNFERTLVETHGLPCRGFYNYMDEDLACATNDDEWLNAFFSDPSRIRTIVQAHDPDRVFFRLRL